MSDRIQNLNNNEQMNRYARQTSLPEIGEAGQEKLRNAKVLIVGVGGLGSPIALYLAGAGVGTLGLVDDDQVSISNLQRQVLYAEADLGQPKPLCGAPSVAYVIQQVAGSEVIASVYHYIVVPYQFSGILLVQTEGVYFHVYIAVQTLHSTGAT